jgi:hypothetical protein
MNEQQQLVRENARLRKRLRTLVYGRQRDPRESQKAPDGGVALSAQEMEIMYSMQREGTL